MVYTRTGEDNDMKWLTFNRVAEKPVANDTPFMPNTYRIPDLWCDRQIGLTKTPGQTGGQEDFGSDKGSPALVLGMPRWITYMKSNLVDVFRYHHNFERDGTILLPQLHPNWRTWNGETHDQTSGDFLGKTRWGNRPVGNGWRSFDNEHRSQNNTITYYALTGDYMIRDEFTHILACDLAQPKNRAGAEREVGRLLLTWSKLMRVMPPTQGKFFKQLCEDKLRWVVEQWPARNFISDPDKTVRVLQVILDPRSNIFDPTTGQLTYAWIPYQTAMMALGIYSFYKVTGSEQALEVLKSIVQSVVLHGIFRRDDVDIDPNTLPNKGWNCLTFCRYLMGHDEGKPLPETSYREDSREICIGNSFWSWLGPALAIGRQIFPQGHPVHARATECLAAVYPNGFNSWLDSEWFACAPVK